MKTLAPDQRRAIQKWILQSAAGVVAYGAILFWVSGTVEWTWGWALLAVLAAFLAAHPLILVPRDPDLLVERGRGIRAEGVKAWDRWVVAFGGGVMPLASWIIAGLDYRLAWTDPIPLAYHLGGLLLMVLGFGLFLWAMASNAFFAEGVRIQEERGHAVATQGPYHHVRHPGYAGAILAQLATPLLLGSAWAAIPSAASAGLYILRTVLEDRTLQLELPGYTEYAQHTCYRLIPRIW